MTIQLARKQDEFTVTVTVLDDPGTFTIPAEETFRTLAEVVEYITALFDTYPEGTKADTAAE